ncbi:MAG: glycosyltransferase family 4 protein [Ferruginibacter sp.]
MEEKSKKILVIVQYPENVSPGQRFRVELYKDLLIKNGFTVTTKPFFNEKGYKVIHRYGFLFAKIIVTIKGFARRFLLIFSLKKYDFIFLQREATPIGPPVFEWISVKLFSKKIIYDFDDAIWMPAFSRQNSLAAAFKNIGKVKNICKWSYKVSCGNEYLGNYAHQYNQQVVYNPTCVDTNLMHNILAVHDVERVTIGWTGSFSTVKYLDIVQSALRMLQEKHDFDIKIICNQRPDLNLKNIKYVEWNEANEVRELATCQIGLMPLADEEWSEGKCGFKLIQYLALEIPAVASPVGVNKKIIEEGVNGYFAKSDTEWFIAIEKLLLDATLRKRLGNAGRNKIIDRYSLQSNKQNFLNLFS